MPRVDAPSQAAVLPLDVRDPDVVVALADAVAILDASLRPRTVLGRLGFEAGFARIEDPGSHLPDWIHVDDYAALGAALSRCKEQPETDIDVRARVHNDVDGWHTLTLRLRNLLAHPDVQGILVRAIDETVFGREARWRTLVGESPTGIFELDLEQRCTFVNAAFERLTGHTAHEVLGDGWSGAFHPDDLAALRATNGCELRVVDRDSGVQRWVSARTTPLRNVAGEETGVLGTLEDVTDRKRLEERLEYDATHDRLTGLGSRALLVAELGSALARTRRGGAGVALLFIDLDGFKRVNDTLGHATGDDLLVQVAQRLRGAVREEDFCVRLGGDEFVVCSSAVDEGQQSVQLAERLLAVLSEPYDVHGHEVLVGASIGIASAHGEDPVSVDQLLSNADIASYRAKRLGRGRVEMFDDDLRRRLSRARRVARSVGRLLDEPRVPVLCTPIVHLASRHLVGFDCNIDWATAEVEEDQETIDRVIEEAGLSRALDVSLVRTVLSQLGEWEQTPPGPIVPGLSMTLTRTGALSPLVPEIVRDMVTRSRVSPALCWIGVPESAVAYDLEAASRVVVALDELGVGVALRDFGSAVSSLEQLRRLPAPTMTVAGPLVEAVRADTPHKDVSAALLAAIVQYARALGRIVVAFGVQDEAHALRLQEMGCDFGVGPAFGPIMAPGLVAEFLATNPTKR